MRVNHILDCDTKRPRYLKNKTSGLRYLKLERIVINYTLEIIPSRGRCRELRERDYANYPVQNMPIFSSRIRDRILLENV